MSDLFGDPLGYLFGLILKLPALLIAVTVHELAHALVADRLGDPTARRLGRITLNPLPHIDPLGALAFVLAGFGWAKPVPVDARNFRHPIRDMVWVAVAGPMSNFAVAFVTLAVVRLLGPVEGTFLLVVADRIYTFNLILGVFNLIPLPPLDGGHFLPYLLPRAGSFIHQLEQAGPFLLILLVFSGATSRVVVPVVNLISDFYLSAVRFLI
jgi:Zn-dependent protease